MNHKINIEIDRGSGFCFGVTTAINRAEEQLAEGQQLYCLGDIVHNETECARLHKLGLVTICHSQLSQIHNARVLLRAHGEPPGTYALAKENNIEIVDATCPVVLTLQRRIRQQYVCNPDAQIIIFGKKGHAEVLGLVGQTEGKAVVIEHFDELPSAPVDYNRDIYLYSQTTKSLTEYQHIIAYIKKHTSAGTIFKSYDTICRQVANRIEGIRQFAMRHQLVVFVAGRKSSNGRVLYNECQQVNANTYHVENASEIQPHWLKHIETVGICGATSTPKWLMEQCRDRMIALAKEI